MKKKKFSFEEIKSLIRKEYGFAEKIASKLKVNLDAIFVSEEGNAAAYVKYTLYKNRISVVEPISINLPVMQKIINQVGNLDYARSYIRYIFAHELRHAWQAFNNKEILIKNHELSRFTLDGAGELPAEKDCDDFAVKELSKLSQFDSLVAKYQKACHMQAGAILPSYKEIFKLQDQIMKKLGMKKKWFTTGLLIDLAVIGVGISFLIYKSNKNKKGGK